VFNRRISTKYFAPKRKVQRIFNRRFLPIIADKDSDLHRRDVEYAEEIPFAQSGDDDWAKPHSSNLRNVFVCRCLPTNKNSILCALCASAVIFLKGFLSVSICVNLRLIAFDAGRAPWNTDATKVKLFIEALFHRARYLSPDSVIKNSAENFECTWLASRFWGSDGG